MSDDYNVLTDYFANLEHASNHSRNRYFAFDADGFYISTLFLTFEQAEGRIDITDVVPESLGDLFNKPRFVDGEWNLVKCRMPITYNKLEASVNQYVHFDGIPPNTTVIHPGGTEVVSGTFDWTSPVPGRFKIMFTNSEYLNDELVRLNFIA